MAKPIILMIESDLPTIELYRGALKQKYEVLARGNESGALEVLSTVEVCAVILEPALGGGRGWKICAAILSAIHKRPVPVILCSTLDERKRGLEMGATAFLVKPVLPSVLLDILRQLQISESIN